MLGLGSGLGGLVPCRCNSGPVPRLSRNTPTFIFEHSDSPRQVTISSNFRLSPDGKINNANNLASPPRLRSAATESAVHRRDTFPRNPGPDITRTRTSASTSLLSLRTPSRTFSFNSSPDGSPKSLSRQSSSLSRQSPLLSRQNSGSLLYSPGSRYHDQRRRAAEKRHEHLLNHHHRQQARKQARAKTDKHDRNTKRLETRSEDAGEVRKFKLGEDSVADSSPYGRQGRRGLSGKYQGAGSG